MTAATLVGNPLLEAWRGCGGDDSALRRKLARRYAWGIPNDDALDAVAAHSPLVEIGAGTGYWAALLADRGADIVAYDLYPPDGTDLNGWHDGVFTYYPVAQGGAEKAAEHPDRALLLCWPPASTTPLISLVEPVEDGWERHDVVVDGWERVLWHKSGADTHLATDALFHYEGDTLIYVGEMQEDGATGGAAFLRALHNDWEQVASVEIPRWEGLHDRLTIYRRPA